MKSLPFTDYMKELRKVYNSESKKKENPYVFTSKNMQKMEDLYRLRNKEMDVREETPKPTYSKE